MRIELMDTTLRDGEQTQGVSYSPTEKLHIATVLLKELKVDRIEVASARVSTGEFEAIRKRFLVLLMATFHLNGSTMQAQEL
jgi:D-citramalate synthase